MLQSFEAAAVNLPPLWVTVEWQILFRTFKHIFLYIKILFFEAFIRISLILIVLNNS